MCAPSLGLSLVEATHESISNYIIRSSYTVSVFASAKAEGVRGREHAMLQACCKRRVCEHHHFSSSETVGSMATLKMIYNVVET